MPSWVSEKFFRPKMLNFRFDKLNKKIDRILAKNLNYKNLILEDGKKFRR